MVKNKKVGLLSKRYIVLEKKLISELDKMEHGRGQCSCGKVEFIKFLYEGDRGDEIMKRCLNCGGEVSKY